jgi:spermidine synthase
LRRIAVSVALAQVSVAALAWAAMWLWQYLPISFVWLYFQIRLAPELLWTMKCLLAMAVMTPAALGMGVTFPLLTRAAGLQAGDVPDALSRTVGRVYAANTLGSLAGAFLSGFVWLPNLWVAGTTLLCISINLLAAVVAAWTPSRRPALLGGLSLVIAALWSFRPPWEPLLMTSGVYKYVDNLQEPTMAHLRRLLIDRYELLYYNEGLSTVVTVARDRTSGNTWLANNGKIDASTSADMPTQVLVAHIPMMFLPPRPALPVGETRSPAQQRSAMLIGLASGITLGALTLHPDLDRIDVVELEPSMPSATALFKRFNHDALSDPRVNILGNDGRNQLLLSAPQSYDLVVAEPSNPWLTGVSNLFTREFFEMGKSRLKPGGVWSQWVQMYGMDGRDLKSVIRTFSESFPYVLFFSSILDADMVMVGSNDPIVMTDDLAASLTNKTVGLEGEFANINVLDGYDLLADYLFDREQALQMTEGIPLNTDDNLLVEYSAPKNLHRTTSGENMLMLLPVARVPSASVRTVTGLVRLADAYAAKEDLIRALIALKEADAREPGRPDVQAQYRRYQKRLKAQLK